MKYFKVAILVFLVVMAVVAIVHANEAGLGVMLVAAFVGSMLYDLDATK